MPFNIGPVKERRRFDNHFGRAIVFLEIQEYANNNNSPHQQQLLSQMIPKIVFVLHPTHVEVTTNAANRNDELLVHTGTSTGYGPSCGSCQAIFHVLLQIEDGDQA
jgi:hypothetical protein